MYNFSKRTIDLIISLVALIILAPLFLFVIILLKFTDEGEVFYKQSRIGYKNQPFKLWKFATMLKDSSEMKGGAITVRNDPRVTKVGKYLRMTKVNELPQLINVFKGDMSIVGPRPLMEVSFKQYPKDIQECIYDTKPGITGIGSIFFRDEEKLVTDAQEKGIEPQDFYKNSILPYKGKLELWYKDYKSTLVDIKIIIITALAILFPKNNFMEKWLKDLPDNSEFKF